MNKTSDEIINKLIHDLGALSLAYNNASSRDVEKYCSGAMAAVTEVLRYSGYKVNFTRHGEIKTLISKVIINGKTVLEIEGL